MEWIHTLFFGSGIGHSILLVAIVIFIGIYLGKVKIAGVSLGITWILFVGIIFSACFALPERIRTDFVCLFSWFTGRTRFLRFF